MKTLYITDLDGTLLNNNAELSEESKKLISDIISRGAYFTVATARTFATVTELFKGIDLKLPFVLMNGVMLYDTSGKRIHSYHSINYECIDTVFEIYKKHGIYPLVYRCKDNLLEIEYYNTDNPYQMKYIGNRTETNGKRFILTSDFDYKGKSEILYIVTLDTYEKILPLYKEISLIEGISCVFYPDNYTDCYFLEIFAADVSKATAMSEVKNIIGADRIVAFGDNLNDIEMFQTADMAYAVENACDELKAIATGVIGKNTDDAVAKFIFKNMENIYD